MWSGATGTQTDACMRSRQVQGEDLVTRLLCWPVVLHFEFLLCMGWGGGQTSFFFIYMCQRYTHVYMHIFILVYTYTYTKICIYMQIHIQIYMLIYSRYAKYIYAKAEVPEIREGGRQRGKGWERMEKRERSFICLLPKYFNNSWYITWFNLYSPCT